MSLMNRTAFSAVIFVTLGLASVSAPGLAYDLNRPTVSTPSLVSDTRIIPSPAPLAQPDAAAADPAVDPAADPAAANAATDDSDADASTYASLSEAVAAQDMPDQLDGDLKCLAEAVYFESKGEPLSGQLAVAKVILNRAQSGRFPKSVCSVVTQAGQFSFVRGGVMPRVSTGSASFRTATAIAQLALRDGWSSAADDALYFHARRVSPGWRMTRVASIGNHVFYR